MFIAHGEWLRKYSRWILGAVLLILVPGFVVLFSTTGGSHRRQGELPLIHGKPVNPAEYQQARESAYAQLVLNTGRAPRRTPDTETQVTQETVLRLLLLEKARQLGIRVTDEQLTGYLQRLPLFADSQGRFDPERYRQTLIVLRNQGISEAAFEQLLREQLIISQLHDLVASAAKVTPAEARLHAGPLQEKVALHYVAFRVADFTNTVTVTDDEAKKYFADNQESFREPEKLKVRYALVPFAQARASITIGDDELTEYYELNKYRFKDDKGDPKPLDAVKDDLRKELLDIRAERKAGDQATELSVKLVFEPGSPRPDLAKLAAPLGATIGETGYFLADDEVPGVNAGRAFVTAAFSLSPESPFSDPVRGEDGYYVLELLDRKPSAIPAWETARPKVMDQLRRIRAYDALVKHGTELAQQIQKAVAAGTNFVAACAAQRLEVQTTKPFRLGAEPSDLPAAARVAQMAIGMTTNAVSGFVPGADGGLIFHVAERAAPEPGEIEKQQPEFASQLLQRKREALWRDWLNALWSQSQVDLRLPPRPAAETPEKS